MDAGRYLSTCTLPCPGRGCSRACRGVHASNRRTEISRRWREPRPSPGGCVLSSKDKQREECWCDVCLTRSVVQDFHIISFLKVHSLHSRPLSFPKRFSCCVVLSGECPDLCARILSHARMAMLCSSQQLFVAVMP